MKQRETAFGRNPASLYLRNREQDAGAAKTVQGPKNELFMF
jgi:hypothetical protein